MSVKMYSKKMSIGGELKNLVLINYSNDKKEKESLKDIPIHHIQILDRSGSMSNDIDQLIEDCKKTILQMKTNDYYTIIWFSGPGEFRTILKGVPAVKESEESSFKILDSIKSTIGCTCFSESVKETEEIVEELTSICPNFSITLFTDGQPCCPWSDEEEYKKVNSVLERIYSKIISFNTIGYGNYCNEEVLESWAMFSEFGEFIHSSKIEEYYEIFEDNTSRVRNLECSPIDLKIKGRVFFYCTSNSIVQMRDHALFNHSDKNKNQFILILNENENITFTLNGEKFNTEDSANIQDNWIPGILYRLAYVEYCYGDRYVSQKILGSDLRDKKFADAQISAFSPDEIAKFKKSLKKAAFRDSSLRNMNTCPDNYVPVENTPCLLDLLHCLVSSDNSYYIPAENYNRIGKKTIDEFNMFHKYEDESEEIPCPISNLVFNEKKLNISIRFALAGYVSINPKQAEKVGLDPKVNCMIYRTHTIVKDGCLNIDKMSVYIDNDTFNNLIQNFKCCVIKQEAFNGFRNYVVDLDLTALPIINASYGNSSIEDVFELVALENRLKADIKLSKFLSNKKSYEEITYTPEQYKLLEEYGIKNGVYNGIKPNTPKVENCDFYMSRTFELQFKGFSSLSAIKLDSDNNPYIDKPKNGDLYLSSFIEKRDYCGDYDFLKTKLAGVKAKLSAIRIAKILTGKWFDNSKLSETKKPEIQTYTGICPYTGKSLVLNIKRAYEKSYF